MLSVPSVPNAKCQVPSAFHWIEIGNGVGIVWAPSVNVLLLRTRPGSSPTLELSDEASWRNNYHQNIFVFDRLFVDHMDYGKLLDSCLITILRMKVSIFSFRNLSLNEAAAAYEEECEPPDMASIGVLVLIMVRLWICVFELVFLQLYLYLWIFYFY